MKVKKELERPKGKARLGCFVCIVGALLAGLFTLGIIGAITAKETDHGAFVVCLVLTAIGLGVMAWGWSMRSDSRRLGHYVEIIANQNHSSVDDIALLLKRSDPDAVMKEIQKAINEGYLPGYALDPRRRLVVKVDPTAPPGLTRPGRIAFKCRACGAINNEEDLGGDIRCAFCQTPKVD